MQERKSRAMKLPLASVAVVVVLAAGAAAVTWLLDGLEAQDSSDPPAVRHVPARPAVGPAATARPALRGLVITLHADDKEKQYARAIREIAQMGSTGLLVIVPFYQEYIESQEIFTKKWHPKEATFGRLMTLARIKNLKTFVLPIVLIRTPRTSKDWRGVIQPPSWDVWFTSYRAKLYELAGWCRTYQVDVLSVGSELSSTETMRDRWSTTIAEVRKRFGGKLIYSSNWDRFSEVSFWELLDYVGITAYWELNPHKDRQPTLEQLMLKWQEIKPDVTAWLAGCGMPAVFTEVGYANQDGCSYWPWNYYGSTDPDEEEQMLCYHSFLKAWSDEPTITGIFMYDWQGEGGPKDTSYTARGKRAAKVLGRWLKGRLQ